MALYQTGLARYALGRCLGTGSTGVVYEAHDRVRGVTVAVKTLRRVDATAFRRLKNEFRALSDIIHPNLVALHELVATDSGCFVVMDLVSGTPFLRWVRSDVPTASLAAEPTFSFDAEGSAAQASAPEEPPEEPPEKRRLGVSPNDISRVRDAFRQLAEGLSALHLHGRLHRDLKPSNVLVDESGRVLLLDFGLVAAIATSQCGSGPVVGTVGYMSPEQAAGKLLTPASDWYAFGTMLFESLTGSRPFVGPVSQLLADKQQLDPPDPAERCRGLPSDLLDITRSLLARDPRDRLSGAEVVARLGGTVPDLSTGVGLVGRSQELGTLASAWERARAGQAVLATVRGRSGIGKTALIERFLATIEGSPVLLGRCYERESVPYKALDSVVDALAERYGVSAPPTPDIDAAGSLFPVLRRGMLSLSMPDPQERRSRGFRALLRLFEALSPLIVVVDDSHWGDADSAIFFSELLNAPFPVLVLMTWRSEEQDTSIFLQTLLRVHSHHIAVDLDHLPYEDCCALARCLLPRAEEDTIDIIAKSSGGHPLFVHELARANRSDPDEQSMLALDDVIRARVAHQPESVRILLELVAVAGQRIGSKLLGQMMGADIVPELSVLRAGRLVRTRTSPQDTEVEPYHDRVREAVVDGLPAERRAEIHRQLACALTLDPAGTPSALAMHWFGAGQPEHAIPFALTAAQQAEEALAFDHAASLLRMVREASTDREQYRQCTIRLGHALSAAGRPSEAADVWLSLDDRPAELQCLAAAQLIAAGHVARGLATLEDAANRCQISIPRSPLPLIADLILRRSWLSLRGMRWTPRTEPLAAQTRAKLDVCWSAVDGIAYIEPLQMASYHARHLSLALAAGDPRSLARAFITEAGSLSFAGGTAAWTQARNLLDEAGRAVALTHDGELLGLLRYGTAMLAYQQHRFDEAYQIALECETLFRESSAQTAWHVSRARMMQCWCHLWRGRLRAISDLVPRMVKDARERGNLYIATSAVTDIGYILGLIEDTPDDTWLALDEREKSWAIAAEGVPGFHLQHINIAMARIQLVAYRGEIDNAYALADALRKRWRRSVLSRSWMFRGLVLHLFARAAIGVLEQERASQRVRPELLQVAYRATDLLSAIELPHVRGSVAGLRGRIAWVEGKRALAEQLLRESVVGLDGSGILLLAHSYRRYLGNLLGGEEGRTLITRADSWFREQGVVRPDRFAAGILHSQ